MNVEELEQICKLTVELTRLRQNECSHLCIENFAPELLGKLIDEFDGKMPNIISSFPGHHEDKE